MYTKLPNWRIIYAPPIQQMNIGYLIVSKESIFWSGVRKWMRKTAVDNTWGNFITHFYKTHQELRETDATTDELG